MLFFNHFISLLFPPIFCSSYSLFLLSFEPYGTGWDGAYYSVHAHNGFASLANYEESGPPHLPEDDYGDSGIAAGTLDWGYIETESICIPKIATGESSSTRASALAASSASES